MQLPNKIEGQLNPIAQKIKDSIENTITLKNKITEAKICVACDITPRNFKTIFERNIISKTLMASFLYGNIIDENDKIKYVVWLVGKKQSFRKAIKKGKRVTRRITKSKK